MSTLEFRVWRDRKGEWLWILRDSVTKQPIAVSGRLHPNYETCLDDINLVKSSINAEVVRDF